jgi:hypothetical protein
VAWDNACYWSITALLFFKRRLIRPEFMESIDPLMRRFFVLHARMQRFLKAWSDADEGAAYAHASPNVVSVPWLRQLQACLSDAPIDDDSLRRQLEANFSELEAFARTWQKTARTDHPGLELMFNEAGPLKPDVLELLPAATPVAHAR